MPRRSQRSSPEELRKQLVDLLHRYESLLSSSDVREKVRALIPAFHTLRDLGCSLLHETGSDAARNRLKQYFLKYPRTILSGDELMVVAGIGEWARRIRELRVEHGWPIITGVTARQMVDQEGEIINEIAVDSMAPDDYMLLDSRQDKEAANRWQIANEIRKKSWSVRKKILEFLRKNVAIPVTGEELRYVAGNRTEWARRIRELRTEHGWPIVTRNTGRPDLSIGVYLLEKDRQSPAHDRNVPDPIRRAVLIRDSYRCAVCHWDITKWNRDDPRHLELHHIRPHAKGGSNHADNLVTLCTVCHDQEHRKGKS